MKIFTSIYRQNLEPSLSSVSKKLRIHRLANLKSRGIFKRLKPVESFGLLFEDFTLTLWNYKVLKTIYQNRSFLFLADHRNQGC